MVMLQLYLGGWGCSGGKIQKGDEQQRKRARSVTQFGAIIVADNNELSCVYKKVSSSDNMHKAVVGVDVSTPGAIVTAIVAQSTDQERSEESSIELIEFSSLR